MFSSFFAWARICRDQVQRGVEGAESKAREQMMAMRDELHTAQATLKADAEKTRVEMVRRLDRWLSPLRDRSEDGSSRQRG